MEEKRKIIRITTWIAGIVAVSVTLFLPLGYFAVSYQYLAGSLEAEAEMTSRAVTELINGNPELWQFEQLRLEELLARRMRDNHPEARRILDRNNRLIAESGIGLKPPLLTRRFNLMDAGAVAGSLEIDISLNPLLHRSGLVALLGLSLGVAIFVTLRVLPLRAVALADKARRASQDQLTEKVAQLEAALASVKQLEGIIPICMYCKKIRNDQESWQQLESYISEHSEADFSHGICPECFEKAKRELSD